MKKFRVGGFVAKPPDLEEFLKIGLIVKELLVGSRRDAHSSKSLASANKSVG